MTMQFSYVTCLKFNFLCKCHLIYCIYLEDDACISTWTWSRTVPSSKPKPNMYLRDKPYRPMGEAGSCIGNCSTCDDSCRFGLCDMWAVSSSHFILFTGHVHVLSVSIPVKIVDEQRWFQNYIQLEVLGPSGERLLVWGPSGLLWL